MHAYPTNNCIHFQLLVRRHITCGRLESLFYYLSTSPFTYPIQIHSTSERHVTVCGLIKGLEHKFRVAAVNQAGQGPFVTSQILKVNEPSKNACSFTTYVDVLLNIILLTCSFYVILELQSYSICLGSKQVPPQCTSFQ